MLLISLSGIIKVVVPESCIFFWIPGSIAEAAAVIPSGATIFLPMELLLSLIVLLVYLKWS